MDVQVRGRNIQVTPALKDYVEKRLSKMDKFADNYHFGEAQVTMKVEKESHRVEVTIPVNGMILRGEETTGDMYSSIDLVVEKLEKQINRFKGKLSRRGRALNGVPYVSETQAAVDDDAPKILRNKRFNMKPMSVEEAVLQMNLLGHSFFVFSNADSDRANVVYKRKDGNYGLIEPEA
ncbi:sigma 54 modulation protein/ribosomal protein S30EA [Desulfofarcimen acetoxidans DSM 771]|jgi:putative sigma-54 modulation protein|uniref:Ribosome hibernation promoting factor n=1 Tax=Desulfofarcimen acetoxidans (strain ATCC 49208 / DSM 771 / KCTC 5769 / VKM B-1644 / 5575) TaxID=485916 RepID=C8VY36_DESAS|nr:ribosome-associated translation inhibitor RaiA [Desulfofarcimen acetoxidans]ACV64665.1 sigma 54 modulation protein/ribosomal protein S30EA [Desulfofarcimen acetoxidans DSM 771]